MRTFISVLVLAAAVTAQVPPPDDEPSMMDGLCISQDDLNKICMAGSRLQAKIPAAMKTCMPTAAGRNMDRETGCPTFSELMQELKDESAPFSCVFKSIGWIDAQGNEINKTVAADMASLKPAIRSQITPKLMESCIQVAFLEAMSDPETKTCFDAYTDAEKGQIDAAFTKLATFNCFIAMFNDACTNFVQATYIAPLLASASKPLVG